MDNKEFAENLKGKKVSVFADEDTKILGGPYREDYNILDVTIKDVYLRGNDEVFAVGDFVNNLVLVFRKDKLLAVWNCYDLAFLNLNKKRGCITSSGHETSEIYWLDDGEFEEHFTR